MGDNFGFQGHAVMHSSSFSIKIDQSKSSY